jgi:hypothetical protein
VSSRPTLLFSSLHVLVLASEGLAGPDADVFFLRSVLDSSCFWYVLVRSFRPLSFARIVSLTRRVPWLSSFSSANVKQVLTIILAVIIFDLTISVRLPPRPLLSPLSPLSLNVLLNPLSLALAS